MRVVEVGTSALFLITVVRRLGPDEYGAFGMIIGICAIANLIIGFGFAEALNRYLPEIRVSAGRDAIGYVGRRIFAASLLLTLAVCFALWLFRGQIGERLHFTQMDSLSSIIVVLVIGESICAVLSAASVAIWRMKAVFLITGTVNVLAAVGAIVLVWVRSATAESAALAATAAFAFGTMAYVLLSRTWLLARSRQSVDMKPIWQFGRSAWLVRLGTFVVGGNVVVILMGWLLGDEKQVAYFNCAYVPLFRLQTLILGWALSVLPSFSEFRATRGVSWLMLAYRLYVKLTVAAAVPVFAFVAWYSRPIVMAIFGQEFLPANLSLRVYAILTMLSLLAGVSLTTLLLYSLDGARAVMRLRLVMAAAHLVAAYWLISMYGALGSVIAVGLCAVVTAVLEILLVSRSVPIGYPFAFIGKAVIVSGVCLGVTVLLQPSTVRGLLLAGLLYLGIYVLLLCRWKPLDREEKEVLSKHPRLARALSYL